MIFCSIWPQFVTGTFLLTSDNRRKERNNV